jgi:hypothetical protein
LIYVFKTGKECLSNFIIRILSVCSVLPDITGDKLLKRFRKQTIKNPNYYHKLVRRLKLLDFFENQVTKVCEIDTPKTFFGILFLRVENLELVHEV